MTLIDGGDMRLRTLSQALITGGGFILLGYGSRWLSGPGHMVSLIWPGTAFGLCMMLRLPRSRAQDLTILSAIFLAHFALIASTGTHLLFGLSLATIGVVEVLTGLVAVRCFGPRRFRDLRSTLRFLVAAIVAPAALGAVLAAALMWIISDPDWLMDSLHWFSANFLGFCIILPFGLNLSWRQIKKLNLDQRKLEAVATFASVTLVSVFVLQVAAYPVLFLILAVAIIATARFRLLGAGAAILIVLTVALIAEASPHAPQNVATRILIMQVFLAVTSLICARAAMVLNERELHLAIIERRRRRAVRASRFKSELLSHVSQEVRGPLSAIIGISSILEAGKVAPERAQEFAHIVAHNGELLQRLYDDLSDLACAETGALVLQFEKVAVGETVKNCVGAIRLNAALGGKSVLMDEIAGDLSVQADPQRLAQIINSLIANSYKYGDNHSPIRVRASRLGDGFGRIEILNAGPGIPLRERDALFQPFGNEHRGRQVPGAGLGLSIAKMLAEKQGGRIDFESIPGRQTRFWIDLPLAA
jgi:signal transduction histidine kinase